MARPSKQGVDYFPLDVHLDDKFKFIEIKYKLEGFAILIKLMQKIYSCGYWYRWTDDEALLFSDELRTDFDLVQKVVSECLERDVFNKDMYEEYDILTSKGIQKRYKEIVRRRKDVEVTEEYLLIDDMMTTSRQHNDDNEPSESEHDDGKSTQSKVKESKQKESNKDYSPQFEEWWSEYPRKLGKKKSFSSFKTKVKAYGYEKVLEGLKGYKQYLEREKTDERFIKHPSTFLNEEAFNDFIGVQEKEVPQQKQLTDHERVLVEKMTRMDELMDIMDRTDDNEEFKRLDKEYRQLKDEVYRTG
jgi:hypothetical protein